MAGLLESIVSFISTIFIVLFVVYILVVIVYAIYHTYFKKKRVDVTKAFEAKLIDAAMISKPTSMQELYIQPEGYSGQRVGKIVGYTTLPMQYEDLTEEDVFIIERFSVPVINKFPIIGQFFKKFMVVRHPSSEDFRSPLIGDITLYGSGLSRIGRFYYVTTTDMLTRRKGILDAQQTETVQETFTTLLKNIHTSVEEAMKSDSNLMKKSYMKDERISLIPKFAKGAEEQDEYEQQG
jgi:hypothetical protein